MSSPDTGAPYQGFYNKVRSEHDAINNGYAEARRRLAAGDSGRALDICNELLEKYPGQALFQALKFDVEEHQRQQLSAFIADVNRRLEAEPISTPRSACCARRSRPIPTNRTSRVR